MVRGIAMITDICRQPGDGAGFRVNVVDTDRLKDCVGPGRRFPFGLPLTDNANYLWIQLFDCALNAKGRAGFVMANSASEARAPEQEIQQKPIERSWRLTDREYSARPRVAPTSWEPAKTPGAVGRRRSEFASLIGSIRRTMISCWSTNSA